MKCERSIEVLGTVVRVVIDFGDDCGGLDFAFDVAFAECVRIDEAFSRFRQGNELWRLNQNVGQWVCVSEELFYLIEVGEKVRIRSGGAFDLGVKRVLEKLGYDRDYGLLEQGLRFKNGGDVENLNGRFVSDMGLCEIQLRKEDLLVKMFREIDLGGLGKGYALDGTRAVLENMGLNNFLIDCGGDIFACGNGWKVAFENPLSFEEAIGSVFVDGFFLASSSGNRRIIGKSVNGGCSVHHLVDMRTLSSAKRMMATYVQCGSGIFADAWATALFVMGFEEAKRFLEAVGERLCNENSAENLEAMIIGNGGEVFRSRGFRGEIFT